MTLNMSLLKCARMRSVLTQQRASFSVKNIKPSTWGRLLALGGATTAGIIAFASPVFASDAQAHSPALPWSHHGMLSAYDHASVRRGYQVYKEVCAACHSMQYLAYRQLVNAVLTEDEAKAEAAEIQVRDGPDDEGNMFDRPGRLTDILPSPYPNVEAARAANNGAAPPDLTYLVKARHGNEDYVFHLLTGYTDVPPGRVVAEGQYYNPYFPGGAISMARALYDDMIQFEDGTPATTSQMAKDVVTFLSWSSDRNHDQRKRFLFKALVVLSLSSVIVGIAKRKRWSTIKSRKLIYKNRPMPKEA